MSTPQHILVVIDPTTERQPALERAAWLAKRTGMSLMLFICDYDPQLAETRFLDSASLAKARASLIENHKRRLRQMAAPLAAEGIEVTVDACWDYPLHEGIVRKAVEIGAALVMKDTHYHSVLRRSIFSNTDWNLIRSCPIRLWLVKARTPAANPCFVAAVDPLHERDKPAELDREILKSAKELAGPLRGDVHVFHAFDIAPVLAVSTDSMTMPISLPVRELTDAMRAEHTTAVHALTDANGIPRHRVHIHQGSTRELLAAVTEQLNADVVVMGAVSRSGLARIFLGNTAEEVLDTLSCDVLIVKPASFARAAAADAGQTAGDNA
jgi:universal stress protein E